MQESSDPGGMLDMPTGTKLSLEESAALDELLGDLMVQIAVQRGDVCLTDDGFQNDIGQLLQQNSTYISHAVPFAEIGLTSRDGTFDIVVRMRELPTIVEVCSEASAATLETMYDHLSALKSANVQCKVFLAIDVMSGGALLSGVMREFVKMLMTDLDMGVILGDASLMIICSNHHQLMLEEMPEFLFARG